MSQKKVETSGLDAERMTQGLAGRTANGIEGIAAFIEARPARFIDS
ncbi:MAG: hypothetical protein Q8M88_07930 [Phenylobacterium sp.]|nr:hypothetical protein [Phenylobacterium sp.]MDP3174346.1 hypothetical protein [Phenylobacterium sp.]